MSIQREKYPIGTHTPKEIKLIGSRLVFEIGNVKLVPIYAQNNGVLQFRTATTYTKKKRFFVILLDIRTTLRTH